MKPLRTRLQEARTRLKLPWEVLERDYLLSWILAGLSQVEELQHSLAFKGGTALKKCYFGDYRLSEDLDFSGLEGVPTATELEEAIREACRLAEQQLGEYAAAEVTCYRYEEKEPHPGGQEAFIVRARLPWHNRPQIRAMIEVTMDEPMLWPLQKRRIIHEYGEPLDVQIHVYTLEEIVAEKLRAILQHEKRREQRGWSRSRARDFYDLWRILVAHRTQMKLSDFAVPFHKKCEVRDVAVAGPDAFFEGALLAHVAETWEQWLGPLVPELPPFEEVISELRPQITDLLSLG